MRFENEILRYFYNIYLEILLNYKCWRFNMNIDFLKIFVWGIIFYCTFKIWEFIYYIILHKTK